MHPDDSIWYTDFDALHILDQALPLSLYHTDHRTYLYLLQTHGKVTVHIPSLFAAQLLTARCAELNFLWELLPA